MRRHPGTLTYIKRGVGYALTSALALLSGFLVGEHENSWQMLLLCVPFTLSISFFIAYAICFHYDPPESIIDHDVLRDQQSDALTIASVVGCVVSVTILFYYKIKTGLFPPMQQLVSFVFYGSLYNGYAFLLYKYRIDPKKLSIRHQLIWPAVLTIAVSMYFGLTFKAHSQSYISLIPSIAILLYFLLTEFLSLSRRSFTSLGVFLFSAALAAISTEGLGLIPSIPASYRHLLSAVVFAIPISAYLACFESWRVTAYVSQLAHHSARASHDVPECREPAEIKDFMGQVLDGGNPSNYYYATLAAMTTATLLIPFVYIFSGYGTCFLAGFLVFAAAVFGYWIRTGWSVQALREYNWISRKLIAGFLFLAILVIDSWYNHQPQNAVLREAITIGALGPLMYIASFPGRRLRKMYDEFVSSKLEKSTSPLWRLFLTREAYIMAMPPIATVACAIILILRALQQQSVSQYKAHYAFISYAIMILVIPMGMLIQKLRLDSKSRQMASAIVGIFALTRGLMAAIVGTSVFLPCFVKGSSLQESLLAGLPFALITMGGFALNDYFDYKKDRINEPKRAIPSGRISRQSAVIVGAFALLLGIVTAVCIADNTPELVLYLIAAIGVLSYNIVVLRWGYFKGLTTAVICSTPVVYDIVHMNYSKKYYFVVVSLMLFIVGREILMDIKDMRGDNEYGVKTVPLLCGVGMAEKYAFFALFLSTAVLLPLAVILGTPISYGIWIMLLLLVVVFYGTWICRRISAKKIIGWMRISMLLGLALLLV